MTAQDIQRRRRPCGELRMGVMFQRTGRSQLFQFFQALGADILPLEYRDVFGGVAENAAGLVFFRMTDEPST